MSITQERRAKYDSSICAWIIKYCYYSFLNLIIKIKNKVDYTTLSMITYALNYFYSISKSLALVGPHFFLSFFLQSKICIQSFRVRVNAERLQVEQYSIAYTGIKPNTYGFNKWPQMRHYIYTEILFILPPIFKNEIFEAVYCAWHLYRKTIKLKKEDNYIRKATLKLITVIHLYI